MLQVNSILFPTDGSTCAEYAHAHAAFLAEQFDAELHVLHVVETSGLEDLAAFVEITEEDILEQLHAPITSGPDEPTDDRVHHAQRTNESAAEGILTYADGQGIDLVVMGTHGRRGMDRLLMGSVAEEVVRRSVCPVLTVCGNKQPAPDRDVNRILVPLGLSDHSDALFAHARAIGATYGAHLDLLHVIESSNFPQAYGLEDQAPDEEAVERRVHEAMTRYADAAQEAGVDATVSVRRGHPVEVILDILNDEPADLVTIATHGRTGIKRLLIGSVAEKVVRMAPCPVFTVKSFGKALVSSAAVREDGAGPHSE
ncbi:MAG: universal stress protein [Bacteroidetes bacterium]|jgi:nucleotide-binding universal stress UspA family protein|nr:universal stress protein [Bacteroidota bacterium]